MPRPPQLARIDLRNFRAFERFSITFGPTAVLVGPNNAGKSTVISAIRATAAMLRTAKRLRAQHRIDRGETIHWAHLFTTEQVGLEADSLRWESRSSGVELRAEFTNHSRLTAVWPPVDEGDPYFFVETQSKRGIRDPADVRQFFPTIGVVPPLAPIERREELRDANWVRDNIGGRLASRHFRNQLRLASSESLTELSSSDWTRFYRSWLPEIDLRDPELTSRGLDVYYRDDQSQSWKEIVWAGDGFQVFLQTLFHLRRLSGADVLVLDEPDVYLHADLQRRLMQAAQTLDAQIIVATHSTEMTTEVGGTSTIWLDRGRRRAVRAPEDEILDHVAGSLGSVFNLRLARVLRAKQTLFVEGDDMKLLKTVARLLGMTAFVSEAGLAVVPIEGWSNWRRLEGFAWLNENLLRGSVPGLVVLDRDYHSEGVVTQLTDSFRKAGLNCHVWERKELESYLLVPAALGRVSGAPTGEIDGILADITADMYEDVLFQFVAAAKQDDEAKRRQADATVSRLFTPWLREVWKSPEERLRRCPAKDVLSALNSALSNRGFRPVSIERLARSMSTNEIPAELADVVRGINRQLTLSS